MFSVRSAVADELPHLRRYAVFLARDEVLADDLVQDCVARAIDRAEQFRPGSNLRAWLFTILRSVFLNHQRSAANRPVDGEDSATDRHLAVPANQESRVDIRRVEAALAELSSAHRDILLLIVVEGFSYEEASHILEVPLGTIRSRLARARGELHRVLQTGTGRDHDAPGVEAHG